MSCKAGYPPRIWTELISSGELDAENAVAAGACALVRTRCRQMEILPALQPVGVDMDSIPAFRRKSKWLPDIQRHRTPAATSFNAKGRAMIISPGQQFPWYSSQGERLLHEVKAVRRHPVPYVEVALVSGGARFALPLRKVEDAIVRPLRT